jgi:non-heme chloroperoxidase
MNTFTLNLQTAKAVRERSAVGSSDGTMISVQEYGLAEAPAIILLHPFGGNHLLWMPQLQSELAEHFRLVTFDHRGHGESGKPAGAEAYNNGELFADDLDAVMRDRRLVKPILVGWSMSGVLLADYLAKYGDGNVGGVVLNAAANNLGNARCFEEQLGPAFFAAQGIFSVDLHEQLVAWRGLNRRLTSAGTELDTDSQVAVMASSLLMSPAAKAHIVQRQKGERDHLPTYQRLRAPLLIFHGNDDEIVLRRAAEQVVAVRPDATVHFLDAVGHSPNWEARQQFNAELLRLANSIPRV